jgi:ketosteroid isomerase-like protein
MTPATIVRALYEAYQDRDWARAEPLLHPDVTVDMPATNERLAGRPAVLGFQRDYPEPWGDLEVSQTIGGTNPADTLVAAGVEVHAAGEVLRMAAHWECRDGLLWRGVEYWVTVGGEEPPAWREHHPVPES